MRIKYKIPFNSLRVSAKMAAPMEAAAVKQEPSMDKQTVLAVLQFLKKNNLKVILLSVLAVLFCHNLTI